MEQSTNFGFNLPSRDTDDIVDVNQISDNFRIIDENMVSSEYVNTKILPYSLITKGEKNIFSWDTPDGLYTCPKGKFITFETSEGGKGKVPSDTIFTDSQCLVFVGSNIAEQDYRDKFFTIIGDFLNTDYIFDENGISIHQIIGTYAVRRRINIEASSGYEPEYWFDIPFSQKGKTLTTNDFTDEYKEKLESIPNDIPETDQTYNPESENAQSGKAVFEAIATEIERVNNTFAPAIKNTVSGETVLINDIASVEHGVGIKVRSKNLFNASKSKFYYDASINGLKKSSNGRMFVLSTTLKELANLEVGETYILTATHSHPEAGGEYIYLNGSQSVWKFGALKTITQADLDGNVNFYKCAGDTNPVVNEEVTIANIQIEKGKVATAYTPYMEDFTTVKVNVDDIEYTPSPDGTIYGVKSAYPSMSISTDTAGAIIQAEYNADTKKYIDNKFAELQALVLEG